VCICNFFFVTSLFLDNKNMQIHIARKATIPPSDAQSVSSPQWVRPSARRRAMWASTPTRRRHSWHAFLVEEGTHVRAAVLRQWFVRPARTVCRAAQRVRCPVRRARSIRRRCNQHVRTARRARTVHWARWWRHCVRWAATIRTWARRIRLIA
jgi:hypothetical protein